ncbi:MAG: diguanylate cyclase domain-containing protein [Allorhizobium sp.]
MVEEHHQSDALSHSVLLSAIGDELCKNSSTEFVPALERLYQEHLRSPERLRVIAPALTSILIVVSFLLLGYRSEPSAVFASVALWLAAGILPILVVIWWLDRNRNTRWRTALVIACILTMTLSVNIAMAPMVAAALFHVSFTVCLIIVASNVVLGLGFHQTVVTSILTCLLSGLCVSLNPALPTQHIFMPAALMIATAALTLMANHRIQKDRRQIYLLLLREKLQSRSMRAQNDRLNEISYTDPLTGIANRRRFDDALDANWEMARKSREPLALMMIDIDHFKRFNDTYGHPAGDECLQRIAGAIAGTVHGQDDLAARLGGEEFAIILRNADRHSCAALAKNVHDAIERLAIPHAGSITDAYVSVSIGLAVAVPYETGTATELLVNADRALYRAKRNGRKQTGADPMAA